MNSILGQFSIIFSLLKAILTILLLANVFFFNLFDISVLRFLIFLD